MSNTVNIVNSIVNVVLPHAVPKRRRPETTVMGNKECDMPMPQDLWMYESRMAFHVILMDSDSPEKPVASITRLPFDGAGGYNKAKHFYPKVETCQGLDMLVARQPLLPSGQSVKYGLVTLDITGRESREWYQSRIEAQMGLDGKPAKGIDVAGERYRAVYASFTAGKAWMLYISAEAKVVLPKDLGLWISSDPKAAKRVRRFKAHHDFMMEFTVDASKTEYTAEGKVYHLTHIAFPGRDFTVLDFNMKRLSPKQQIVVDGMHVMNLFDRLFGRAYAHTKGTFLLPHVGLAKGFGHVNPAVQYDVVLYGTKAELVLSGDKAYLGSLGTLKMHDAKMDIQTLVNMGFYEPELVPAEGRYWMDHNFETLSNEEEAPIRDLCAVFANMDNEDDWALMHAIRKGVGSKRLPVLWRRLVKLLFEGPIDPSEGRIPMHRIMRRLDVAPNPTMFSSTGVPCMDRDILTHENYEDAPAHLKIVCCWDMPEGRLWMARNPNTHSGEAILVWNVHVMSLKMYRGRGLVFFGFDACELLVRLNGADMDDSVLATSDERYIAKWQTLHYPVVPKIVPLAPKAVASKSLDVRTERERYGQIGMWTQVTAKLDLQRWLDPQTSLGTFINRIMLDTLLSGEHKQAALVYLRKQEQTDDVKSAIVFLENREDYMLRREASNSDLVIDYLQMHKGDAATVAELLKHSEVVMKTPVFPMCWDLPMRSRIPAKRKAAGDYLLVETKACKAINELTARRNELLELARQKEYLLACKLPEALDETFFDDEFVIESAQMLRSDWRQRWEDLKAEYHAKGEALPAEAYDWILNGRPRKVGDRVEGREQGFYHKYTHLDDGNILSERVRRATAVEMYKQIYRKDRQPVLNQDGTIRSYPDGLPDKVLHDLLNAFEQAGLTGQVAFVTLDPQAKRRLSEPVQVKVLNGRINTWVIDQKNGLKVGTLPTELVTVPDGTYMMSPKGVIVVQESVEELQSGYKLEVTTRLMSGDIEMTEGIDEDDLDYRF